MNDIIKIIKTTPKEKLFAGNVSTEEIKNFEENYKIELPVEYKLFIENFGAGNIEYTEIFGLGCPSTGIPNIEFAIKSLEESKIKIPKGSIPITFNGAKYIFIISDKNHINYGMLIDEYSNIIYKSFYDFILESLD